VQGVPNDGSDQQFFRGTGQWCCGGIAPLLNVGGTLVGEGGAAANHGAASWDSVSVVSTTGSAVRAPSGSMTLPSTPAGSGAAVLRYETTVGGLLYRVDRTITYVYPDPHYTETYAVTVPAGNAAAIKLYLGGDAAPGDSDQGEGATVASPRRSLFEINSSSNIYVAFHEVQGLPPFSHYFVGTFSTPYAAIAAGGDLPDTVQTGGHDAGMDVQWDIPGSPGTHTVGHRTEVNVQGTRVTAGFPVPSVNLGDPASLELRIDNTGFTPRSGLGVSVALPAGLTVAGAGTNACGGTLTAATGGSAVSVSGAAVGPADGCTVSVPVAAAGGGTYSIDQQTLTVAGGLTTGYGSAVLTVAGPSAPPAPAPPAPSAPVTPAPATPAPAAPARLLAPMAVAAGRAGTTVTSRVALADTGRYTFIVVDRVTGARIPQMRGSRLGARTLTRRSSAPVLTGVRAGTRMVLRSVMRVPGDADIALRIVRRAADGTLADVTLGPSGTLG
jgi:hypothetical protein